MASRQLPFRGPVPSAGRREPIRRRARGIPACLAVVCAVSLVAAVPASARTLFHDGFEAGDFTRWTLVKTTGDGTVALQSQDVHTGAVAAELSESSRDGSTALMRKTLTWSQHDLTASGNFRVAAEGAHGGSVPLLTFLDSHSARVVSVYRRNGSGRIGIAEGTTRFETSDALALNTWGEITAHAIVDRASGGSSGVKVRLNGTLLFQATYASLARTKTVQLGNDIPAQEGTVVADDISVSNASPSSLGS
jgi:hypothetical protein